MLRLQMKDASAQLQRHATLASLSKEVRFASIRDTNNYDLGGVLSYNRAIDGMFKASGPITGSNLVASVRREEHQLLIIGNGFDLSCGLPSSFSQFFASRMKKIEELAEQSDEPRLRPLKDAGLTVWDIILAANNPELNKNGDPRWADVEAAMERVLLGRAASSDDYNPDAEFISADDLVRELIGWEHLTGAYIDDEELEYYEENCPELIHRPTPKEIAISAMAELLKEMKPDVADWDDSVVLDVLEAELRELEDAFNFYLGQAVRDNREYKDKSETLLRRLVSADAEVFGNDCSSMTTILSFNYTTPTRITYAQAPITDVVNVHGRLGEEIVFGIDGTSCSDVPDVFRFTKTYRLLKLKSVESHDQIVYPPRTGIVAASKATVLIKFYGHSLAKADYSYFQSLFDMVDLYNGSVKLFFYYRKHSKSAERNMYDAVTRLLTTYGTTMDNKDHGKNLLHKLMLEGRISIREI